MASAISFTAADVRPLPGAIIRRKTCASAVNAGNAVYLDSSGNIAKAASSARATSHVFGIAVADNDGSTAFAAADAVDVVVFGPVAGASSLAEGTFAYCGTVAGVMEDTNPGSGNWLVTVGICESTAIVFVNPQFHNNLAVQTS